MIDVSNLKFADWSVRRKKEALRLMEMSLRKQGNQLGHDTIWREWGGGFCATPEETEAKLKDIASNDEKFINALFCYYICMTTDFSWFNK